MHPYPIQDLRLTNPDQQQRHHRQPKIPYQPAFQLPTVYDEDEHRHSALTRSPTTIHHRRGQSIDRAQLADAIRASRSTFSSSRTPPAGTVTAYTEYQHMNAREAQQQRQARPDRRQHSVEYDCEITNTRQAQQRRERPRSLVGLDQFRDYEQKTIRPRSVAIGSTPLNLDAILEHNEGEQQLGLDGPFGSVEGQPMQWHRAYEWARQARQSMDSRASNPAQMIGRRIDEDCYLSLPPSASASDASSPPELTVSTTSSRPGTAGSRAKTPISPHPVAIKREDSITSFPSPRKNTSFASNRQVTAIYNPPPPSSDSCSTQLSNNARHDSTTSLSSAGSPADTTPNETHLTTSTTPTFDLDSLRAATLTAQPSAPYGSVQQTGITPTDISRYISYTGSSPSDPPTTASSKYAYACTFPNCGKRFGRKENVKSHVQTHLNDRQFVCTACEKRFVRCHDLKRHALTHTGVNPYDCACGKKFGRMDALTRHRQRGGCCGAVEGARKAPEKKRGRPRKNLPAVEVVGSRQGSLDADPSTGQLGIVTDGGEMAGMFDFNDLAHTPSLPSSSAHTSPPTPSLILPSQFDDLPLFAQASDLDFLTSPQEEPYTLSSPIKSSFASPPKSHRDITLRPAYTQSVASSPSKERYLHSRSNSTLAGIFSSGDPFAQYAGSFESTSPSLGYATTSASGDSPPPSLGLSGGESPDLFGYGSASHGVEDFEMLVDWQGQEGKMGEFLVDEEERRRLESVERAEREWASLFIGGDGEPGGDIGG